MVFLLDDMAGGFVVFVNDTHETISTNFSDLFTDMFGWGADFAKQIADIIGWVIIAAIAIVSIYATIKISLWALRRRKGGK